MYAISRAIIDGQEMMSKILKIKAMQNFNAEEARKIYESKNNTLNKVLNNINTKAHKGQNKLYVNERLSVNDIEQLEERGFMVYKHSAEDIEMYNTYYTISF